MCSYTLPRTFEISYFKLQEIGIQLLHSTKAFQQTVPKLEPTRQFTKAVQAIENINKHFKPCQSRHYTPHAEPLTTRLSQMCGSTEEHACLFNLTREKGGVEWRPQPALLGQSILEELNHHSCRYSVSHPFVKQHIGMLLQHPVHRNY